MFPKTMNREHLYSQSEEMANAIADVQKETTGKLSQFRNRATQWLKKVGAITGIVTISALTADAQQTQHPDLAKNDSKKVAKYEPVKVKSGDSIMLWGEKKEKQEKIVLDGKELTADEMKIYQSEYKAWKEEWLYDSEAEFIQSWQKAIRNERRITNLQEQNDKLTKEVKEIVQVKEKEKAEVEQISQENNALKEEINKIKEEIKVMQNYTSTMQNEMIAKWKELTGMICTYAEIKRYLDDWEVLEQKQKNDVATVTAIQKKWNVIPQADQKTMNTLFQRWTAYKHPVPQFMNIKTEVLQYFKTAN
jgi:cell division protein FtsB